MDFVAATDRPETLRTGCLVVGVFERAVPAPAIRKLDTASQRAIDNVLARRDFEGKAATALVLHNDAGAAIERVLLLGLGPEREFDEVRYRRALAAGVQELQRTRARDATFALDAIPVKGRDLAWRIEQAILAVSDGFYRFDQLKSKAPSKPALERIAFQVADRDATPARSAIHRGFAIAEGVVLARDLGNLPGNICTPTYLASQAREIGKRDGLEVTILDREEIERLGMGAFLAVARGSLQPPKLIVMEYRGGIPGAQPVVLVGKGITFDAGGISIKPAPEMDEMKFDMCGAASVFGALRAAALMKLPLDVVGIVPATENMPGGNAIKPGDVVTTMSGQTVEILDTDSEGRLVLCDALAYAERYKPAAVVDVATLTGEIVVALGDVATGLFSNDKALASELLEAGDEAWDRAWQMPLWDEYQETLKSNFADLPNVAARDSAITAACFLSRFTRGYSWAHLDIAGTASRSGAMKGATGRPVALLAHFLARRAVN